MRAVHEDIAKIGEFSKYHQGVYHGNGVFGPGKEEADAINSPKEDDRTFHLNSGHNLRVVPVVAAAEVVFLAACSGDPAPSSQSEPSPSRPIVSSSDNRSPKPSDPIALPTVTPNANPTPSRSAQSSIAIKPSGEASVASKPATKPLAEAKPSVPAFLKAPALGPDYTDWVCPRPEFPVSLKLSPDWQPETMFVYSPEINYKPTRVNYRGNDYWGIRMTISTTPPLAFTSIDEFVRQERKQSEIRKYAEESIPVAENGGIFVVYQQLPSKQTPLAEINIRDPKTKRIYGLALETRDVGLSIDTKQYIQLFKSIASSFNIRTL